MCEVRKIRGRIVPGAGLAHIHYKNLIPKLAAHWPEIEGYDQFGTINVELEEEFDKRHADCWLPQIIWQPIVWGGADRTEAFGFRKIRFQFPNGEEIYDAWSILPESHPYTYGGPGVEILVRQRVPGVAYGKPCAIYLEHAPSVPRPDWYGRIFDRV